MNLNKLFFIILIITSSLFSKEENLQKTTLQLAWKHQWQFAGYYMAKEKGFYKDAGFDVDIKEFNKGVHITNDVESGKVDFGVGRSSLIYDRSEGKNVVMLASILQHSPIIILTKNRDDIKKVSDLKNKKIMLTQDQIGMASINSMFFSQGVKPEDYIFQQHSFNVQDLIDGKTDALLAYISNEPYKMKKQSVPYNIFSPRDYGFDFLSDILFTSDSFLEKKPEMVKKFRKASLQGWQYAIDHPDETTNLILKKYNSQNKTKDALEYESEQIIKLTDHKKVPLGHIEQKRIEYIAQIYRLMGLVNKNVSFEDLVYKVEDSNKLTQEEKKWLHKNPITRIAVLENWEPFDMVDKEGNRIGFHTDLVKLINKKLGSQIVLVPYSSWVKAYKAVTSAKVHSILSLSYTKQREEKYFIYSQPYHFTPYQIVVKQNSSLKTLGDLSGKKIAVRTKSITETIAKENIESADIVFKATSEDAYKSVNKGESDATLIANANPKNLKKYNLKVVNEFYHKAGEIYIGTNKQYPIASSIISKGLNLVSIEEFNSLRQKWFSDYFKVSLDQFKTKLIKAELTKKEKEFIKNHPKIRVHNEKNWPPFNFYEFGEPKGYSIDLMKLIAGNTGLNIEFVTGPTWDQFLSMMKSKELDVMLNIVKSEEREKYLIFTDSFLSALNGIAVRKNDKSIKSFQDIIEKNKILAVERGFYYHEYIEKHYPNVKMDLVDDGVEALRSLSYGNSDATIGMVPVMNYLSEKNYINNLRYFGDHREKLLSPIPIRLATRKDLPQLQSILQKGLASITPEQYRKLNQKWLGAKVDEEIIDLGLTKEEIEWLKQNQTIKFTGDPGWLPFEAFDEKGNYEGIVAEHLKLIEDRIGVKFEKVKPDSWDDALQKAVNGEVDLISGDKADKVLGKELQFVDSYIDNQLVVVMREDRDARSFNNLNEIKDKKIAYISGYGYVSDILKTYPEIKFVEVGDIKEGLEKVSFGKIDALLCTVTMGTYNITELGLSNLEIAGKTPIVMNMSFAVRKDWKIFQNILNKAIASIKPAEQREIIQGWIVDFDKKIKLTEQEQAWIDKHKSLNYVYDVDWAPFEWKNELGEHTGIIYDILALIQDRSGIELNHINTEKWSEAVDLMKTDKADMYSGIGENPERKEYLNFTKNTIFKTPYVFVSREDDKNDYLETFNVIKNKKVAVVDGYTIHGMLKVNVPKLPLLTVKTISEGFEKVRSGEIDIFIVNAATAKYFINRKGFNDLQIATKTEFNLELKIALQKEIAPEALTILEKAIESLSEKELSDIYFKWTEIQIKETVDWDLILKIIAGVSIILIGFIYWNRTMAREIAKRKQAEIELTNQKLLFEKLFSAAPDAITLLKGDGRFADCNDAALGMFGVESKEKFLALKPDDLSPQMQPDGILSSDAVMLRINEAFEKGKASFEWLHIRPDNNQTFFADVVLAPFMYQNKPLIYAIIRDITDRKEAERLIQKQKEEIEKILSNILLPVLITSKKDRTILYANSYAQIQYETSIEDMLGSSIDELYSTNGQQEHILKILEKQGRVENIEEIFKTKSGKEFTALLSVTPIEYQSQEAFIGMVTDITKIKEIENEIRQLHKHTKESIEYASMIQYALVPSDELFKSYFKDFFTIWEPKDIVGGDIYLFEELRNEDESLLLVIDCTGHGVPGAFVTMLVKAIERQITSKIILEQIEISPAEILSIFNKSLKQLLKQEDKSSTSNAGFDGQVLYYNKKDKIVKCASARNEIFYIQDNEVKKIKGDRFSVGYRDSDANYTFKEHTIDVSIPTSLYISSDGYWDQLGGEKELSFGKKRIMKMIEEIHEKPMEEQKDIFYNTIIKYQANLDRQDDITFIGIKI